MKTQWNIVTVKEWVNNNVKGYQCISNDYINQNKKLLFICDKGHSFEVTWKDFLQGTRCLVCFKNYKKTTEQFKSEVSNLVSNEYIVLGKYINSKTKILIKHNVKNCNHEWFITPDSFLRGKRCPKCFGHIKKDTMQFKAEVFNLVQDEYTVLGEYVGNHDKIKVKHNKCNYEYEVSPSNFIRGRRCPNCSNRNRDTEKFKEDISFLVKDEYSLLTDFVNTKSKVLLKHNLCGNSFSITPSSFLNGTRCPICMRKQANYKKTKTHEQFFKEIYNLVGDEYTVESIYISAKEKVLFKHCTCNNEFYTSPNLFLRGTRCPVCNESKGEKIIRNFLIDNNLYFETQYSFNNLTGVFGKPLKFDFAIFSDINKTRLKFLIEYDGVFHFKKQYKYDGYENLQIHDKAKTDYCTFNNLILIRIPYWDFDNIETILKERLL